MIERSEQVAADIATAMHHLRRLEVGETLPYATLSTHMGFDVRERRHPISQARKQLWEDERVFIGTVNGVGFKRMSSTEAGESILRAVPSIRKKARRAVRQSEQIGPEDTSPEVFQRVVSTASSMAVIAHLTTERTQKRLAASAIGDKPDYKQLMKDSIEAMK